MLHYWDLELERMLVVDFILHHLKIITIIFDYICLTLFSLAWVCSRWVLWLHTCQILWLVGLQQGLQYTWVLVRSSTPLDYTFQDLMVSSKSPRYQSMNLTFICVQCLQCILNVGKSSEHAQIKDWNGFWLNISSHNKCILVFCSWKQLQAWKEEVSIALPDRKSTQF